MPYQQRRASFWERNHYFRPADFTVLGGGIVGMNAALRLRELHPSARIVVLERGTIPAGASTRNAGFACFGSPGELLDDVQEIGWEKTAALVRMRLHGLDQLRRRVGDAGLRYAPVPGYELFDDSDGERFAAIRAHLPQFNTLLAEICGGRTTYREVSPPLPRFKFGFQFSGEGQIDPAAMMDRLHRLAVSADIQIQYGAEVVAFSEQADSVVLQLASGNTLRTGRLIVAVNGFARQLLPDLDVQPARNQVLITEPLTGDVPRGNFHLERGYVYFRNVGNRILLGGGRHLNKAGETTDQFGATEQIEDYLDRLLHEKILPGQRPKIATRWSGILGVGKSREPIVSRHGNRIVLAVRLGGMGVAIGTLVGNRAAELFR